MKLDVDGILGKLAETKKDKKEMTCITISREYKEKYDRKFNSPEKFNEIVNTLFDKVFENK